MSKFTLYWKDGKRSVVEGSTIEDAFTTAGYGKSAVQVLDFFIPEDNHGYAWNSKTREWDRVVPLNKEA